MNHYQIKFENMLLQDLQVIVKVAEFRSITKAATSLDMQTATASAAIKRVEHSLGTLLFIRTTRQLRLSSAGERYIPQCEQALLTLDQAKQTMKGEQDIIDGALRIALSSDFGRNIALPWLDEFVQTHPAITLRAHISDRNIDFYRDPVDVALRYGSPDDTNLYGFKICDVPRVLCASHVYLSEYGLPQHPDDLVSHNGLFYQLGDITNDIWEFTNNGQKFKCKMKGNRISNDGDLVRRWCVSGQGIALKSCLDMSADLLANNIVNVLPQFKPVKQTELWLVCPSRQSITPAVRLLRDHLKEKCQRVLDTLIDKNILPKYETNKP